MHRRIGLSVAIGVQIQKIKDVRKTTGRYAAATALSINPNFLLLKLCASTGNKHTANDVARLRMLVIFYA